MPTLAEPPLTLDPTLQPVEPPGSTTADGPWLMPPAGSGTGDGAGSGDPADLLEEDGDEATPPSLADTFTPRGVPENPIARSFQHDLQRDLADAFTDDATRQRRARQEQQLRWHHQALLDPAKHFEGVDLSFAPTPEAGRQRLLVDLYLQIHRPDQPLPTGLARDLLRDDIARARGWDDAVGNDLKFHGHLEQGAFERRDAEFLFNEMAGAATSSALVAVTESGASTSFETWLAQARTRPGYQPGMDFAYREQWNDLRAKVRAHVEPYLGPLKDVFGSMQAGGAAWYRAYDKVPDQDREEFLASLALLARTLPKQEQATFWSNLKKQAGRDLETQTVNILDGLGSALDMAPWSSGNPWSTTQDPYAEAAAAADERKRKNFIADVERIRDETYDPVKVLNPDNTVLRILEQGAYAAPGAIGTTVTALIPYVGPAATYWHMQESAYRDMRRALMDGDMPEPAASDMAEGLAPLIATPSTLLERVGASALTGKLPGFEKFLAATANKFSNPALRYGGRVLAGGFYETLIENTQAFIPQFIQEAASALNEDVPGVVWRNGRDGFLDGYWEKTGVTFVAVMPLAVFLGASGFSADARARAFAETPDLHLRVLGISTDGVARIRAAELEGGYQARQAIEAELSTRNPLGEDARSATEELTALLQEQQDAVTSATQSGNHPTFHRSSDGWSVRDGESGTEIGKATTTGEALRLAIAHSDAIDEENASQVAYLASLLDAAEARAADQPGTTFDIRPGEAMTTEQKAAESEVSEARVFAQVKAREAVQGIGQFADIILGSSETEFRERVRHTTNRIHAGGSVLTVFHEDTHGFFREAIRTGRLTRADTITALRAFQTVLGGKTRDGTPLRLLPDGEVTDVQLDEAVAEFMEAEILRTRRSGKHLPPGILARNLTAAAKLAPGAATKFARFVKTVREYFGVALHSSVALQKGIRDGTIQEADIEGFTTKLFGLDQQHGPRTTSPAENLEIAPSFSISRARAIEIHEEIEPHTSPSTAQKWKPHKGFRAPRKSKGRFLGDRGNSDFQLSDKMADEMGVPRGTKIPWREGIPDFGQWAVPGPKGIPKQFDVPGLTGDHDSDKAAMVKYMAEQTGETQMAIKIWLSQNKVDLHHVGANSVQIVPREIHQLPHSGGAQQLRLEL